jgi:hypothetical protein
MTVIPFPPVIAASGLQNLGILRDSHLFMKSIYFYPPPKKKRIRKLRGGGGVDPNKRIHPAATFRHLSRVL